MNVVLSVQEMREISEKVRRSGDTIALVPTMGALHEGHLALVREAARQSSRVTVSIFVNPTQFGPNEDFERYPRDLEGDLRKLGKLKVDHVFVPDAASMYAKDAETRVELARLPNHLCGLNRVGHFSGVATVVLKLFNICRPDVAVFGLKDYQQMRVIEKMVADLDVPVRVVRHPTVREPDGLAMSSRNAYLSAEERARAPVIYATLRRMAEAVGRGEKDPEALVRSGRARIEEAMGKVEYLSVVDPDTLDDVQVVDRPVVIAAAVRFGNTRLIDNVMAEPGKGLK